MNEGEKNAVIYIKYFISDKYNDIKVELYSLNLCYRFSFLRSEMAVVEYCSGEIFLGTIWK